MVFSILNFDYSRQNSFGGVGDGGTNDRGDRDESASAGVGGSGMMLSTQNPNEQQFSMDELQALLLDNAPNIVDGKSRAMSLELYAITHRTDSTCTASPSILSP